jgi:hypothetical protein
MGVDVQGVLMFARKIQVDVIGAEGMKPCPMAWMDNYSMRSFTGREAFDETLPVADGLLEASFQVDLDALRVDMEDWLTRKFGGGKPVQLRLSEKPLPAPA